MAEGRTYQYLKTTPIEDSPPPYRSTWGSDVIQGGKSRKGAWKGGVSWSLAYDNAKNRTQLALKTISRICNSKIWPFFKKTRFTKKQSFACFLVSAFGILPFFMFGMATGYGSVYEFHLFAYAFAAKTINCGDSFVGTPQNSTVEGVDALFVLDFTFGRLPFSQAKLIDVAWDIFVGRGAQLIAWWIAYTVFSEALLRVIERHPATFRIFQHIALTGPGLRSLWELLRSLFRTKSKRTWLLYFYLLLSTAYVLSIPAFLSAMTGYDSVTIAWVDIDQTNNIVPASNFRSAYIVWGTRNETWSNSTCAVSQQIGEYVDSKFYTRRAYCNCQTPNGTVVNWDQWMDIYYENDWDYYMDCNFHFPGQTGTYTDFDDGKSYQCSELHNVTIANKVYAIENLNTSSGYCIEDKGYRTQFLFDKSRCLPDTAHPSYSWGFSTALSGIFIILHFVWAVTMYIVWQDAQFNSKLVKSGYEMTQLRAAFTLTETAKRKMSMHETDLVRTDTKGLERELFGSRKVKIKEAEVDYTVFKSNLDGEGKGYWEDNGEDGQLRKRRSSIDTREV